MSTDSLSSAPPCFDFLGCEMIEMGGGKAVIRCVPSAQTANPGGTVLGGIIGGFIDNAAGPAIVSAAPERPSATVSMTINFLRPIFPGEAILVTAEVVRMGSTQAYIEATIVRESDKTLLVRASVMNVFLKH